MLHATHKFGLAVILLGLLLAPSSMGGQKEAMHWFEDEAEPSTRKAAQHTLETFANEFDPVPPPPKRTPRTVMDEAKLFGQETLVDLNAAVAKIKEQHHKDLFIETVEEGPEKALAAQWAKDRFNGIGLDGVYVVIAKKPGFYRIVVGKKTLVKLFKQSDIAEMEKILNSKQSGDKKITQAALFVLETMNKVNESALREIKDLRGDWIGPMVDVPITKDGKTAKRSLVLRFSALGGEATVGVGVEPDLKNFPIELKDNGKRSLVLRGADAGEDLTLTYEVSDTRLAITAPRSISVSQVSGKVDLSGDWKRPTKKE